MLEGNVDGGRGKKRRTKREIENGNACLASAEYHLRLYQQKREETYLEIAEENMKSAQKNLGVDLTKLSERIRRYKKS